MARARYPDAIETVIEHFSRLPGIGRRTAERLTLAILEWPAEAGHAFAEQIGNLHSAIHPCGKCGNFAEEETCRICSDPRRNQHQICVVEDATQIPVIENSGCFDGLYHVLGGRLVPLEGIGPEELSIESLHKRIERNDVEELILATGSDVEGEATAAYLAAEFEAVGLEVTRIASGIPVGADLGYADAATIAIAMNKRNRIK